MKLLQLTATNVAGMYIRATIVIVLTVCASWIVFCVSLSTVLLSLSAMISLSC